jgi:outer membrane protein assembly factor BamB
MKRQSISALTFLLCSILFLSSVEAVANWPEWRGPFFNGMARGDAPATWTEKNVKWRIDIPGRGHSTPVTWGDKIFLTTAIPLGEIPRPAPEEQGDGGRRRGPGGGAGAGIEHKFELICVDRKTGKIAWRRTTLVARPHEGYHHLYGSFASNSPVTDGRYVYVSFGSRGIYCYDLNGKPIWQKDLGVKMRMRLQFGEGVAPALAKDRLILTYDQEEGSFIVALDTRTGRELWRTPRDERSSWSTPLIIERGGKLQAIVSATNKVRSYDVQTGKVIWECAGLGSNVIPAPVYHDGVVYVMSGHRDPKLMAIRFGKEGDLTGTDAVMWSQTRGIAYTASPVLHEGKLYVVTDSGRVSCFNIATGEPYYHQVRLTRAYNFKASPVGASGKLYFATEEGDIVVMKMGEKPDVIATNSFENQTFIASPIILDGELYLRSQNQLYCIRESR